ncbi:hypothetical protein STPYR_12739 [uncultured Stenotrophomonas sp.]|uniref:Uncharacterized protein n=1 Tax=uncultured Stenotrophomonas sp. TaxID=165438 RepID=A0A1Y5Q900_9GAMM|nr:hypothetical protein STPYR_12739 [uncultured Stenotrophomonas sp.]
MASPLGLASVLGRRPRIGVVGAGQKLTERQAAMHVRNVQVHAVDALRLRQPNLAMAGNRSRPPGFRRAVPVVVLALPVEPHGTNACQFVKIGIATAGAVVIAVRLGRPFVRLVDPQHVPERLELFGGEFHVSSLCGLTIRSTRRRFGFPVKSRAHGGAG